MGFLLGVGVSRMSWVLPPANPMNMPSLLLLYPVWKTFPLLVTTCRKGP